MIKIASRIRDYQVSFPDSSELTGGFESFQDKLYVIDKNVWRLHRAGCLRGVDSEDALMLPADEDAKTMETVFKIYDALLDRSAKKTTALIAIGGGIIQDVAGFAASTLYRGIRWICVPTTLLAQSDSCIGGKTSLNVKGHKNLVGTFYPPHEVRIDAAFLDTLSELDFYSGLGEVVKLHMMGGRRAVSGFLERAPAIKLKDPGALMKAIRASLKIKLGFMKGDEFDRGTRNMLNFGHCFGHALESSSHFDIPHGQAVLIGMLFAGIVAERRGHLSSPNARYFAEKLLLPNIIVKPKDGDLDPERILREMKKDKKRAGDGLALVMMGDGHSMIRVDDLSYEELEAASRELASALKAPAKIQTERVFAGESRARGIV